MKKSGPNLPAKWIRRILEFSGSFETLKNASSVLSNMV